MVESAETLSMIRIRPALLVWFILAAVPLIATEAPPRPQALKFAQELLPQVIEQVTLVAVAGSGGPRAAHYASITLGKDE